MPRPPVLADLRSYGGIYETANPAREYTLDDFVTLNLEKLDRYVHIRGTGLEELEWRGSDDEDDESDSGEDSVTRLKRREMKMTRRQKPRGTRR
jgi:hypothetical protein